MGTVEIVGSRPLQHSDLVKSCLATVVVFDRHGYLFPDTDDRVGRNLDAQFREGQARARAAAEETGAVFRLRSPAARVRPEIAQARRRATKMTHARP